MLIMRLQRFTSAPRHLEKFAEGEKEAMREALSQHVHDVVEKNYNALEAALKI